MEVVEGKNTRSTAGLTKGNKRQVCRVCREVQAGEGAQ